MFTGLITDVGTIDRVAATAAGREFRVRTAFEGLVPGESIAVNGACLTVRACGPGWFTVAAIETTLGKEFLGAANLVLPKLTEVVNLPLLTPKR